MNMYKPKNFIIIFYMTSAFQTKFLVTEPSIQRKIYAGSPPDKTDRSKIERLEVEDSSTLLLYHLSTINSSWTTSLNQVWNYQFIESSQCSRVFLTSRFYTLPSWVIKKLTFALPIFLIISRTFFSYRWDIF